MTRESERHRQQWMSGEQLDLFVGSAGRVPNVVPVGTTKAIDRQVGGAHYKDSAIQPIMFIQANDLSFCEGNAVKYITRHRKKGGKQDLEKAIHYLQLEIEHTYGTQKTN